ncbi:MAG: type III restriction endonuclease subunit R, partial [Planctomycetes bacterium]|nr:type III restriction endonuclease subunit R [Planctomycetota bacterium]
YPAELLTWERAVLDAEMSRQGFMFWYRNPDRPSQDSLGVAYTLGEETQILRPDFLFFAKQGKDVVVDIVDPHGFHLADALPKLQGLAQFAERHPQAFRRIEAVAEIGAGKLRVLDLTKADVRRAVMTASNAESLYRGATATNYG